MSEQVLNEILQSLRQVNSRLAAIESKIDPANPQPPTAEPAVEFQNMDEFGAVEIPAVTAYKARLAASADPVEKEFASWIPDMWFVEKAMPLATTQKQANHIQMNTAPMNALGISYDGSIHTTWAGFEYTKKFGIGKYSVKGAMLPGYGSVCMTVTGWDGAVRKAATEPKDIPALLAGTLDWHKRSGYRPQYAPPPSGYLEPWERK